MSSGYHKLRGAVAGRVVRGSGRAEGCERRGFTLIELLVVVAIIALLISILLPTLSSARQQARGVQCATQLRTLAQGVVIYQNQNRDVLPPSRLPKDSSSSCDPYGIIYGRKKYRPTFVASMSPSVGVPPFEDPQECKTSFDMFGEKGDRQNYSYAGYVCPSVADWTDERNGSYGYNYQFLGNSRLMDDSDRTSYKNWPVLITQIKRPGSTVLMGDCMGTAAGFPPEQRRPYDNNSRDAERFGNEGFNLDPPRLDTNNGEVAENDPYAPSTADPRHRGKANVAWVDGHTAAFTMEELGYVHDSDGKIGVEGNNSLWTGSRRDVAWTPEFKHWGY